MYVTYMLFSNFASNDVLYNFYLRVITCNHMNQIMDRL